MSHSEGASSTGQHKKLGWFLCWAVVFADIGTSLYYVPGILYGQVGRNAGIFVLLTSIVFILLVIKYIEITERYHEGGGVVTVATHAFGPWFGALGGMFITVDYFLTASISSVSGFLYLNSIVNIGSAIVILSIVALVFLGILNLVGISESAKVTAAVAILAFIVDITLVLFVARQIGGDGWRTVMEGLKGSASGLTPILVLTGYAGSFLAFSGLESISQLAPDMKTPRKRTAGIAMALVIGSILITSPLLTIFSTIILTAPADRTGYENVPAQSILDEVGAIDANTKLLDKTTDPVQRKQLEYLINQGNDYSGRFISELGAQYGKTAMRVAVVLTASVLLIFASNTAIIGAYHVFMALARQDFLPRVFLQNNKKFGTPTFAVIVAVAAPVIIIIATQANVNILGDLYAFGLLGAFGLSSLGIDVVRWKEKKFNLIFWIGIFTTFLVFIAWITNLFSKKDATIFGGSLTIIGMIIALINKKYVQSQSKKEESKQIEVSIDDNKLNKAA